MTRPSTDLHPCACECGELTKGQWARGHHTRGVGGFDPARHPAPRVLTPLPDPAAGPDGDAGDLDPDPGADDWPDGWPEGRQDFAARGRHAAPPAGGDSDDEPGVPLPPDPAPGPLRATQPRGAPHKVTATVRRDIEAKIGIMLEVPARVWESRDPLCGGTFVQQLPATRAAFADLVCDSPDMVAWFTGVGGGFMKWVNVVMALQPVGLVYWGHHIAHTIEIPVEHDDDDQAGPQLHGGQAYAA